MPSFWPFGRDETSAASFEKVLRQLSIKINTATAQNERLRQSQRRLKALWTLYSGFAYILVALILVLVTRVQNWNVYEYTAVASGPVVIYGVRTALDAYYNLRLSRTQEHLNELSKQRESSIEKLKQATKYNSTQELLEKYGGSGSPKQPGSAGKGKRQPSPAARKGGRKSDGPVQVGARTGMGPPPTANIQARPPPPGQPGSGAASPRAPGVPPPDSLLPRNVPGEEFAPNAFLQAPPPPPVARQPSTSQYAAAEGPKWYDRILDVVLGEDETSAKNRIVLICQNCRLVNGQAPPGARTMEEVGRWRCNSCQAWNGVESAEKKMLKEAGIPTSPTSPTSPAPVTPHDGAADSTADDEIGEDTPEENDDESEPVADEPEEEVSTPAGSTRSKARQRKKV